MNWIYFDSGVYREVLDSLDCWNVTDKMYVGDLEWERIDAILDALDRVNPYDYSMLLQFPQPIGDTQVAPPNREGTKP